MVVRVVLLQAGCAALVASVFLCSKAEPALAALVGGLIVAAGSAVMGWRAFKPGLRRRHAHHIDVRRSGAQVVVVRLAMLFGGSRR